MSDLVFRIDCGYQNYDWGKIGSSSAVAQFASASNEKVKIDETKPYAELWMGTHPSVPSVSVENGLKLRDLISSHPEKLLGSKIINKFGSAKELPFLFKVLSIEKVLSIQAHPDKELGKKLHLSDPKNYPDDNHKPEMAIAVTEFEGFCGFKPLLEIAKELETITELRDIIGEEISKEFISEIKPSAEIGSSDDIKNRKLLQKVFGQLMNTSDAIIAGKAESLVKKTHSQPELFGTKLADLIQRLNKQFPNDIGLFCGCLLLNHCELNAGEAMFLQAKDPHAYISGDIIECMAASDNVVRAGFTPKFKDVKNLVEMLTYSYESVEKQKMKPLTFSRSTGDGQSILYDPPIAEFSVLQTILDSPKQVRKFEKFDGPSVLICTKGNGSIEAKSENLKQNLSTGFIYFIAPNVEVELISKDDSFTTYRAFVEA